ncbi:hypothetical protein N7504_006793 [Penicillium tannophilum]|nr:hypothetical protein N7504_006793 [Penicillium tannophilum]
MRICVLHSAEEGLDSVEDSQDLWPDVGVYAPRHTVENKYIKKTTAKEQIDEAVAEGYDIYFQFLWGTHDDTVSGVDAIKYFESLNLPSAGIRGWERERSKLAFYTEARKQGFPPVPGVDKFPLFVKPAFSYASLLIDEHSLCQNETELERTIQHLNKGMREARLRRAVGSGHANPEEFVRACEAAGRDSDDVVVQEYIDGDEYSVVVLAMGEIPIPMAPQKARLPEKQKFLTFDAKFDGESGYELLDEAANPALYRHLQETAVKGFKAGKMATNNMGCDVDMRIGPDGKAVVIEVDPMPVWFLAPGNKFEDTDVKQGLAGHQRAAVDIFITNHFLRNPDQKRVRELSALETFYDECSSHYDQTKSYANAAQAATTIVETFSYDGTILDLGCKIGLLGQKLRGQQSDMSSAKSSIQRLVGVDMSNKMLDICRQSAYYDELFHRPILQFLAEYNEPVDHVITLSALQHLAVQELSFVLARCFQIARQSVTISVVKEDEAGDASLFFLDHTEDVKSLGLPFGWKLSSQIEDGCTLLRFGKC